MYVRKICGLVVVVLMCFPVLTLLADGGNPMPPYPPQSMPTLLADGGNPMPPYPPQSTPTLPADGGNPMPYVLGA